MIIQIYLINHRNENRIKIDTKLPFDMLTKIKQINGRKWSKTLNAWHIPYTKIAYNQLLQMFGKQNVKSISNNDSPTKTDITDKKEIKEKPQGVSESSDSIKQQFPKFIVNATENGYERKTVVSNKLIVNQLDANTLAAYVPYFMNNWIEIVKKINGRRWNGEEKYWELPYVQDSIQQLLQINEVHFNFVISADIPESAPIIYATKKQQSKTQKPKLYDLLNDTQRLAITALEEMLMLERKSPRTIKSYRMHIIGLLYFYPNVKPSQITNEQLKKYMLHKITKDKIHERTQGQILNALVAFYKRLLKQEGKLENLFRPKKPQSLPNVFSKNEIVRFLNVIDNLKHKTMMILAYSSGLRRGEIINLRRKDILFDRKCIFVKKSKGKKDRYVMLAENAIDYLKKYLATYQPKYWLFEGEKGGQYGERSIQSVFINAKIKSGVNDSVTLHGLRHSFATHLVDNGVPLHVVKDLLGHESIKTTEVYLHISQHYLKEVKSPLDGLKF